MNLGETDQIEFPNAGAEISHRLNEWGKRDPSYELMVELHPEPGAGL